MGKTLRIWNEFGETPKVSFKAAGQDFFVPRLTLGQWAYRNTPYVIYIIT